MFFLILKEIINIFRLHKRKLPGDQLQWYLHLELEPAGALCNLNAIPAEHGFCLCEVSPTWL